MKLIKYQDYISEKVFYNMILESKLVFSKDFISILGKMTDNKISQELLKLYSTDVDGIQHNYIDVTDEKDAVSFTPDRKVIELTKDTPELWIVVSDGRYLTHSDRNNKIFERLGYEKEGRSEWHPSNDTVGRILKETFGSRGKIYVLFEGEENGKLSVLNKEALVENSENVKIWSMSRNNIKIGRLVRAILTTAGEKFLAADIEVFVNKYKATFDFMKDMMKQFDIVKGDDIAYWYKSDNYVSGSGSLNNSCMANVDSNFLDIYSKNSNVSLVILYDDSEGNISDDGKYTSSKIKGRAILWNSNIGKFMDRIYTKDDSDVDLFKKFATDSGWWFKVNQNMDPDTDITNGKETKKMDITVDLDKATFDRYPYCDTLCYLNTSNSTISNDDNDYNYELKNTNGTADGGDDDYDDDYHNYDDDYYDEDDTDYDDNAGA
jgi:hypothetical protein